MLSCGSLKPLPPVWGLLSHLLDLRGAGERSWLCWSHRQGQHPLGREGEILGAFLSLPVGGREHDKNSGRQDCGGHKKPAQSFLAKRNYLHLVQAGMNICWYTWGTTRASLTFLGLDLKNLFTFWVTDVRWDDFLDKSLSWQTPLCALCVLQHQSQGLCWASSLPWPCRDGFSSDPVL